MAGDLIEFRRTDFVDKSIFDDDYFENKFNEFREALQHYAKYNTSDPFDKNS
ncbi:hypothetical protein WG904_03385 [Pedobacter sp. Du54]|uniref:hypothetical protein n=1 Tax=Pedobacter anseongensis TaxID=3133439 RepID=UPI0030A20944